MITFEEKYNILFSLFMGNETIIDIVLNDGDIEILQKIPLEDAVDIIRTKKCQGESFCEVEDLFTFLRQRAVPENFLEKIKETWEYISSIISFYEENDVPLDTIINEKRNIDLFYIKKIFDKASNFDQRTAFYNTHSSLAKFAKKYDFYDNVCKDMIQYVKYEDKWTKSEVIKAAKSCKTKKEFREKYYFLLNLIKKWDIEDECLSHLKNYGNYGKYTTKEGILKAAQECKTRREFRTKFYMAYINAKEMNILEEICSNLEVTSDQREAAYIKEELVPKIKQILLKNKLDYELKLEKKVGPSKGRIDIILKIEDYDELFPIEVKHDDSFWGEEHLEEQLKKYNKDLSKESGFDGTYLVSPNGRYGFSEEEFLSILEGLIKNKEKMFPNSLDYFQSKRNKK